MLLKAETNTLGILEAEPAIPRNLIRDDDISNSCDHLDWPHAQILRAHLQAGRKDGHKGGQWKHSVLSSLTWLCWSIAFTWIVLLSQENLFQKAQVANNFIVHHRNLPKDPTTQESTNVQFILEDALDTSSQHPPFAVCINSELLHHDNYPIPI